MCILNDPNSTHQTDIHTCTHKSHIGDRHLLSFGVRVEQGRKKVADRKVNMHETYGFKKVLTQGLWKGGGSDTYTPTGTHTTHLRTRQKTSVNHVD